MQILLIILVVAVLLVAEGGPSEAVDAAGWRWAAAVGGMALAPLMAMIWSRSLARRLREGQRPAVLAIQNQWARRTHIVVWTAGALGVVVGLDWVRLVRFNAGLDGYFLVDELLILLPVLLPLVLSWAAFFDADRALLDLAGKTRVPLAPPVLVEQPSDSPRARCPRHTETHVTRTQYVGLHARHYLGMLLTPVLAILALEDVAGRVAPGFLEGPYGLLLLAPALIGLLAFFPELLRWLWKTEPLPAGSLRDRLEATAHRSGVRVRGIHVWRTGGLVVNAAVAGFVPGMRHVFLTDGLIQRLPEEHIEAVFAHELGHLRHHHPMLRVAALLTPICLGLLLAAWWGVWNPTDPAEKGSHAVWGGLALLGAMSLYVLTVFGAFSRRLESQADLFACRHTATDRPVETVVAALEGLALANGRRRARSWQHDSIARRVEFLQTTAPRAELELRYHRRVRLVGYVLVGLAAGALICLALLTPALG